MAEEENHPMPDFPGAETPIPPIDNIHAPVPESEPAPKPAPGVPDVRMLSYEQRAETLEPFYADARHQIEMSDRTPTFESQTPLMHPAQRTAGLNALVKGLATTAPAEAAKAASHGAPARRYLNEKVTGVLLEGMKRLAADRPEDPLRVLGEFLLQKSKELEGTT